MLPTIARTTLLRSAVPLRSGASNASFILRNAGRRAYSPEAKAAAQNAFIKEREAVKHHATETAGMELPPLFPPSHL